MTLFIYFVACGGVPSDVVFVLDSSSSIWGPDFDTMKQFVKNMTYIFDVSSEMTRIGVISFSDGVEPNFKLNEARTDAAVRQNIDQVSQLLGGTNTADALKYMRKTMFSSNNGGRPGTVKQVKPCKIQLNKNNTKIYK